tara:strand:- start:72248 stop:73657 length:1410 start_codon:yes stop_codon:yes gene_type:complete
MAMLTALVTTASGCGTPAERTSVVQPCTAKPGVCIDSLSQLTAHELRKRSYRSTFALVSQTTATAQDSRAFMATYDSDGLNLYARIDLPVAPSPGQGYPVVIIAPGWISPDQAPGWDFGQQANSFSYNIRAAMISRGFAVVTAGYRGRGTINGKPSQGLEFTHTWGNASYLSPIFYSIDVLNLIAGISTLNKIDWNDWLAKDTPSPAFDTSRVSLTAHSQGGDVALSVLAVTGDNNTFSQPLAAASIWSGNIPDRFTQADTFGPMSSTLQAFMSGDGTWTGSARGRDGSNNPDFVFPWPAPWINTLDPESAQWTWQAQQWSVKTVSEVLANDYKTMYDTLNTYVRDLYGRSFTLSYTDEGATRIEHDPDIARLMPAIGGFNAHQFLKTPLALHISDRDYYSLPEWNHDLAQRIGAAGGTARVFLYAGNDHALRVSENNWFSPAGTVAGAPLAVQRDAQLFSGKPLAIIN